MRNIIIAIMVSLLCVEAEGLELELEKIPLDKRSVLILMLDAVGESFECEELMLKNRQALGMLLSPDSLNKANVGEVFLGVFGERAEIKFRVEVGKEADAIRFRRFSERLNQALKVIDTQHVPKFHVHGDRKSARDAAGAIMHVKQFIEQETLITRYHKINIVFVSNMMQTLSKEQTVKLLKQNPIIFPDSVSIIALSKAFVCQDVAEIQKQVFMPELSAFWSSVVKVKEFKFYNSY
ncbi:MAG: hypothetical protein HZA00_08480 [Nitrospinae bacterium]|nr:hypothetical protein [Nitrospinota bacterium]